MEPLALIRNDPSDTYGIARELLEEDGLPVLAIDAWERPLPGPQEISGVVAFGGAMNVDETERFPYLAAERDLLRTCLGREIPILGICLGAQLLARALDAPVVRAPVREIGFTPIHPTPAGSRDELLSCFSEGDQVFHWHEDTFELPRGSELLATGNHIPMQAFRAGANAWGLQFHLEIDRPEIELWISETGSALEPTWGRSAESILQEADLRLPAQTARARNALAAFARVVRAAETANA